MLTDYNFKPWKLTIYWVIFARLFWVIFLWICIRTKLGNISSTNFLHTVKALIFIPIFVVQGKIISSWILEFMALKPYQTNEWEISCSCDFRVNSMHLSWSEHFWGVLFLQDQNTLCLRSIAGTSLLFLNTTQKHNPNIIPFISFNTSYINNCNYSAQ